MSSKNFRHNSPFDPSQFWLRQNWYLSKRARVTTNNILVTEGMYTNPGSEKSSKSSYILILRDLDKSPTVDEKGRVKLPNGFGISEAKWPDFVKAFARFYCLKENVSSSEASVFFKMPLDEMVQGDWHWHDLSGINQFLNIPTSDPVKLQYSDKRGQLMKKALSKLPPLKISDFEDYEQQTLPGTSGGKRSSGGIKRKHGTKQSAEKEEGEICPTDEEDDCEIATNSKKKQVDVEEAEDDDDADSVTSTAAGSDFSSASAEKKTASGDKNTNNKDNDETKKATKKKVDDAKGKSTSASKKQK